jgi:glycosyltransferase 2 family protein
VRDVRLSEVWAALRRSNYWWLVPALGALAVANVMRACRWRYLFAKETRPPYRPVLAAMLIGQFFNNVLPARAGEAARVVALKQSAGTSRAEAVGTIVLERAYDILSVLVVLFAMLPWLPHVTWLRAAAILAVALFAAMIAGFVVLAVYGVRPLRALARPLGRLPFIHVGRTEQAAENLVQGFAALRRPRLVAAALAWTIGSWVLLGLSAWFVLRGFDSSLSPVAGMLTMVATALAMVLPSSPAAVGVFEAAVIVGLRAYHLPKSEVLSYALVLHAVNFFPYLVAGFVVLHLHARGVRSRRET